MEDELESLLFSKRKILLYTDPFCCGVIDDYLPQSIYRELEASFPTGTVRINDPGGGEEEDASELLETIPSLGRLVRVLGSRPFLDDLHGSFASEIGQARGGPVRRWRNVEQSDGQATERDPIQVTLRFEALGAGQWVPPHTDNPRKLLALLIHFGQPSWSRSYGGGTEVYVPRWSWMNRNWNNFFAPSELMKTRRVFEYVPNRLVFLLKSSHSWHGVAPLRCPADFWRRSLLITLREPEGPPRRIERLRRASKRATRHWHRRRMRPSR